ncbi:MAG: EAL domain-containing protein [Actinomycetota bacterium]
MDQTLDRTAVDPLRLIGTGLPLDELGESVCAAVAERAPGLGAVLVMLDHSSRLLEVVASRAVAEELLDRSFPLGRGGGPIGLAVTADETVVGSSDWAARCSPGGMVAAVPIPHDGAPVGAVVAVGAESLLDESCLLHLQACAQLIGLVAGRTDDSHLTIEPVSGLPDRTALTSILERRDGLGSSCATILIETTETGSSTPAGLADVLRDTCLPTDRVFWIDERRHLVLSSHLTEAHDVERLVGRFARALTSVDPAYEADIGAVIHRAPYAPATMIEQALRCTMRSLDNEPAVMDPMAVHLVRQATMADIDAALARGELRAAYQPIVTVLDGDPVGVEALARWHHPDGLRLPDEFVPVLEAEGQVRRLTEAMLVSACRDHGRWVRDGVIAAGFTVSVNVSATELSYADFPDRVSRILRRHGTDPASLRIEITETAALSDRPRAIQVLTELRSLGVSVALDDFGTGYATFASLRSLPIDVVKIDQSFIRSLPDRASETVVHSVIDLAGVLGLQVVAEGVELEEHLDVIRTAGVDLAQGYLFSRPLGPVELGDLLASI